MTQLEQLKECKKAVEQITLRQNDCWYDIKTIATVVYVMLTHMIAEQTKPQTTDYCDVCNHKGCDNCIADGSNPYCVPSHYEPKTEPQRGCDADCNEDCTECAKEWQDWKDQMWTEAVEASKTEPQKPSDDDETIQAIAHLQKVGWLQEHDRALTEPQTERSE